jgi:hypothetical protein
MWTLAAPVAPAQDLQLSIAPDGQKALRVGEQELQFTLPAPIVDAPAQAVSGD